MAYVLLRFYHISDQMLKSDIDCDDSLLCLSKLLNLSQLSDISPFFNFLPRNANNLSNSLLAFSSIIGSLLNTFSQC